MPELFLDRDQRLALKAQAHPLNPVVLLGAGGLTDAVVREIDRALTAHGLIKVRVPGDDRAARESMFASIADRLGAARVQMIGKLLVLYRPPPPEEPEQPVPRGRGGRSASRPPTRRGGRARQT
jgi:putative YhbY family RNA-binding protein